VDDERLVTANSFITTLGTVLYATGLASAGVVFHFTGTGFHPYAAVASTATLAYGLSAAITLLGFRADALGPDDAERPRGSIVGAVGDTASGMVAGMRHLAHRPAASWLLVVHAAHRGLYGVLAIMTLLLYRNYYSNGDLTASVTGLLPVAAASAIGPMVSAFATPPVTRRIGGWQWVVTMVGSLAFLVPVLGLPFIAPLTVVAVFFVSVVTQGTKIVTDTALQIEIDDEYRGRVFSVNDTAVNVMFVLGLFLGALALPEDAHSPSVILFVGAVYAILATWYAITASRLDHPNRAAAEARH
jgi:hypothetical protein